MTFSTIEQGENAQSNYTVNNEAIFIQDVFIKQYSLEGNAYSSRLSQ